MATTPAAQTREKAAEASLRSGSWLMGIAAVGFIGYAVIFLLRSYTDSFLELGIGPNEVPAGKDAIQAFSPALFHYVSHLHIAVSGFIAATGLAVLFLVAYGVRRGELWAWVGAVAARCSGWWWPCRPTTPTTSTPWVIWGSSTLPRWSSSPGRCWRCEGSSPSIEGEEVARKSGRRRKGPKDASTGNPAVRQVRRGRQRLEVRHLRIGCPRARSRTPARGLRPLLHAAVRRLRPGRRPLHLRVTCAGGQE
jgi:hypothetical protein